MNGKPKIDIVDGFIMLVLAGVADGVEFFTNILVAVPVLGSGGPVIASIVSFVVSAILLIWFILKGIPLNYLLVGGAVDIVPLVNILPAKTAAIIATIVKERGRSVVKFAPSETKDAKPQQKEEVKESI